MQNSPFVNDPGAFPVNVKTWISLVEPSADKKFTLNCLVDLCETMKLPDAVDTDSEPVPSGCVVPVANAPVTSKSPAVEPNLLFFTGLPICFLLKGVQS